MASPPEPELPDPVPTSPNAVTPDLPPLGPEAPDIRGTEGEHARDKKPAGTDAPPDDGTTDADTPSEGRPAAGPGTPAPQEQTD
ncbi:hypothetical protein [Streptomyces sp. NPDC003327]